MTGFARLRRLLCRKPSMRRGRRLPPIPNPACRLQRSGLVIPVLPPVSMGAEARDGTRRDGVGHRDGAAYRSAGSPDADHFRRDASGQGRSGTRLAELRRALDVNPNSSVSLMWPAFCEAMSVLGEAARTHAMLSLRLNPWHFRIGVAHLALAMVSFAAREDEDAARWAELVIELEPDAPFRCAVMIACCALTGDMERAAREPVTRHNRSVCSAPAMAPMWPAGRMGGDRLKHAQGVGHRRLAGTLGTTRATARLLSALSSVG